MRRLDPKRSQVSRQSIDQRQPMNLRAIPSLFLRVAIAFRGPTGQTGRRLTFAMCFCLGVSLIRPITLQAAIASGDDAQVTFQASKLTGELLLWRLQTKPGAVPEDLTAKLDAIAPYAGTNNGPITVSPDGAWYVFQSSRFVPDTGGGTVLTIAPADFSSAESVTSSSGLISNEGMAQATPGGDVIVFSGSGSSHTRDLYLVIRANGQWSDPVALTANSPYDYHSWPVLSADGSKVVFNASDVDQYGSSGTRVAEVNLDGSGFRVLVSPEDGPPGGSSAYCSFPAYTADGGSIVFEATWNGSEHIWRRSLSGVVPTVLNNSFTDDNSPNILPDGRVMSLWLGSPTGSNLHEIKIMDLAGQNAFMLTTANAPFSEVDDIGVGAGLMWAPELAVSQSDGLVQVSWPARFTNFILQASSTLAPGSWTNIITSTNVAALNPAAGPLFLRMRK